MSVVDDTISLAVLSIIPSGFVSKLCLLILIGLEIKELCPSFFGNIFVGIELCLSEVSDVDETVAIEEADVLSDFDFKRIIFLSPPEAPGGCLSLSPVTDDAGRSKDDNSLFSRSWPLK